CDDVRTGPELIGILAEPMAVRDLGSCCCRCRTGTSLSLDVSSADAACNGWRCVRGDGGGLGDWGRRSETRTLRGRWTGFASESELRLEPELEQATVAPRRDCRRGGL